MAKPPPNLVEDSMESNKSSKGYPPKAKGMSFFAFLLSNIFIYISIFYIFDDLSPSTLFNTTKFWFFISNTLILIIAADYGAFSSSKAKQDVYEEFMMHGQVKNVVSQHPEVVEEITTNYKQEVDDDLQEKKVIYIAKDLQEKRQVDQYKIHAKETCRPSKSEKPKRVVIDDQKLEPSVEEDEFSSMSDEELNRRFEEFIQRFNRQIRLQGTRKFRLNLK
ncbi:uncharacterized protein LOC132169455 [Corylus avellana]|uniref:uncharacterized protein LOC132169455 n=1 Tax=Corylus avellana TaxID=13451 RepID=UPI00286C6F7B|nr:uncharacterized protein LOC132169455 [Corylus avellana]